MIKCSIKKVDNGFVLVVTDQGLSEFKTRYDKPIFVFDSLDELLLFLKDEFKDDDKEDE